MEKVLEKLFNFHNKKDMTILDNIKFTNSQIFTKLSKKYNDFNDVNIKKTDKIEKVKVQCDSKLNTKSVLDKDRVILKIEYVKNKITYKVFLKFKLYAKIKKKKEEKLKQDLINIEKWKKENEKKG